MRVTRLLPLLALAACSPAPSGDAPPRAPAAAVPAGPPPAVPAASDSALRGVYYVPVYSHIYDRDHRRTLDLAVTLSVRNTDPLRAIDVVRVRYHGTDGRLLREYVAAPARLGPLAAAEYVVARDDDTGGAGASFLVEWRASQPVTEPVVEAVMIGSEGGQGISFLSTGRPLRRP